MIIHPFDPVYTKESEILILGSFPSVKSREDMFYYGHPQNRFWKLLAALYNTDIPSNQEDKVRLLNENRIALWDVISSCDIDGSSDSKIRNVKANDIRLILDNSRIRRIYTNGNKAYELYRKHILPITGIEAVKLPSTSPANAGYSFERLRNEWIIIRD